MERWWLSTGIVFRSKVNVIHSGLRAPATDFSRKWSALSIRNNFYSNLWGHYKWAILVIASVSAKKGTALKSGKTTNLPQGISYYFFQRTTGAQYNKPKDIPFSELVQHQKTLQFRFSLCLPRHCVMIRLFCDYVQVLSERWGFLLSLCMDKRRQVSDGKLQQESESLTLRCALRH